mgnify:CR=1 FL=1
MNHRRMIRYRRHRGYGASALSFVTACWNGLWKETLFSVSSVSSVVSLLLCLFFLSSCHYARPNLSSEEMPQPLSRMCRSSLLSPAARKEKAILGTSPAFL